MSSALGDRAPRGEDAGVCSSAGVSSPELRRGVVGGEGAGGGEAPRSPRARTRGPDALSAPAGAGKPPSTRSGRRGAPGRDPGGDSSGYTIWALAGPWAPGREVWGSARALSQTRGQLPSLGAGAAA